MYLIFKFDREVDSFELKSINSLVWDWDERLPLEYFHTILNIYLLN